MTTNSHTCPDDAYHQIKRTYDEYLAIVNQRLEQNPHDEVALLHKAFMFYNFYKKFDEAEIILQSIIEENPNNIDAYLWNGDFQRFSWGDSSEAAEYLRKAVELDPSRADAHAMLAGALSELKTVDPQDVEYHYRKSFELEPTLINPRLYLAYYLFNQKKLKAARHELEEALKYITAWPAKNPVEEYYESMITGRNNPELKQEIINFIQNIDTAEATTKSDKKV